MMSSRIDSAAESLYELLNNEEDARACREIDEAACTDVPANFVRLLAAFFFSKLGDALTNPKTVLPWVMSSVGAPTYLSSFLVPIRESGSLLPQLAIGAWVRRHPVRKWLWSGAAVVQAVAVIGMAATVLTLSGPAAGLAIVGCLVLFSLARGFASVSAKDVIGKTIPKQRRGRVTGWSASLAGLVSIVVGGWLATSEALPVAGLAAALAGAALLWLAGAAAFATIDERPGEVDGGADALVRGVKKLSLLVTDAHFRRFVIARCLLLCTALSAPFYVLLANERIGQSQVTLAFFVIASGAASLVSAPLWGRFADRSSRRVMVAAALAAALIGLLVAATALTGFKIVASSWFLPLCFFLLSIAHGGARVGRKTYVVDMATGNQRTDYVAVSNSVIGLALLGVGGIGALASLVSVSSTILLLSGMGLAGGIMALSLPEVE